MPRRGGGEAARGPAAEWVEASRGPWGPEGERGFPQGRYERDLVYTLERSLCGEEGRGRSVQRAWGHPGSLSRTVGGSCLGCVGEVEWTGLRDRLGGGRWVQRGQGGPSDCTAARPQGAEVFN